MCWLINLHLKAEHIMMKNHKDGRARFMRIEMKEGIKKIATFSILRWVRNLNEKFMHTTIVDKSREHIVLASCMYIVCNRMRAYGVIYEMKNAVLDYNLSLNKALDMYLWDAKQYRKSAKKSWRKKLVFIVVERKDFLCDLHTPFIYPHRELCLFLAMKCNYEVMWNFEYHQNKKITHSHCTNYKDF